ncbi:MAG: hypothetical protein IPK79_09320 [Vampirovibrionales bacterium]|nr:hypothetical protein [Vampirovibrionales bacterium]
MTHFLPDTRLLRTLLTMTALCGLALPLAACQGPQIEKRLDERIETIQATEKMAAETFTSQIPGAAQQYQIQSGKAPEGFTDFVSANALTAGDGYTLSVANLGRHGGCTVSPQAIACPTAFTYVSVVYHWAPGGQARADVTPKGPA